MSVRTNPTMHDTMLQMCNDLYWLEFHSGLPRRGAARETVAVLPVRPSSVEAVRSR